VSLSVDRAVYAGRTTDACERDRQQSNAKKKSESIVYFVNTVLGYLNLYSNKVKLETLLA